MCLALDISYSWPLSLSFAALTASKQSSCKRETCSTVFSVFERVCLHSSLLIHYHIQCSIAKAQFVRSNCLGHFPSATLGARSIMQIHAANSGGNGSGSGGGADAAAASSSPSLQAASEAPDQQQRPQHQNHQQQKQKTFTTPTNTRHPQPAPPAPSTSGHQQQLLQQQQRQARQHNAAQAPPVMAAAAAPAQSSAPPSMTVAPDTAASLGDRTSAEAVSELVGRLFLVQFHAQHGNLVGSSGWVCILRL